MNDRSTNDIETRLTTLRASILERRAPGLEDAKRRFQTSHTRPIQLGVFVTGVAVLVAALVVYGVNPLAKSEPLHPKPESALAQKIDGLAEQTAARGGDSKITEVLWVATNARAAAAINGDSIQSTAAVYLVEIPGSFALKNFPGPPCSGAVTGNVEFLVIDRSTFKVSSGGVGHNLDDLAKLGTVHVDRLRSGPVFPPTTDPTTAPRSQVSECASQREQAAFVSLAEKGADGTFSATYDIPTQEKSVATIVIVAHLAASGSTSPTSGSWMFEVQRIRSGAEYLWVASPHSTAFCVLRNTLPWSCEKTGLTFPQGNGWSLAAAWYLPLTELYGIEQPGVASQTSTRIVDGLPVDCLTEKVEMNGATLNWCITSSGVLASFSSVPQIDGSEFGGSPADGTVTSVSASAPKSLFRLPAPPGPYTGMEAPPSQ